MFSDELEKISWEETTKAIYSKTDADVRRALGKKEHLDVNDFMALISPAATPYLEVMARLSQKYTMERFGKTISMFVPLYLTNSCTNSCAPWLSTSRARFRVRTPWVVPPPTPQNTGM